MKYNIVLISVFLLSAIYTLPNEELVQLKKTSFGEGLSSLVEMHMLTSNDPTGRLDQINKILDEIEELLTVQSTKSKEWIDNRNIQCGNEKEEVQANIDNTKDVVKVDSNLRKEYLDEQGTKQGNLATEQSSLSQATISLKNTNDSIEADNEKFASSSKDYEEAIKACEEALQLLNGLRSASFIQAKTQSRLLAVTALIQKHVPPKTSAFVQPIVSVLSELGTSTKVDQQKLLQIISLIDQLLEELNKQNTELNQNHTRNQQELSVVAENTQEQVNKAEEQIKVLQGRLEELEGLIKNLDGSISANEGTLEVYVKHLGELEQSCRADNVQYESELATRQQQLETLKRLRAYFHDKVVASVQNIEDESYNDRLSS